MHLIKSTLLNCISIVISKPKISPQQCEAHITSLLGGGGEVGDNWSKEVKAWLLKMSRLIFLSIPIICHCLGLIFSDVGTRNNETLETCFS